MNTFKIAFNLNMVKPVGILHRLRELVVGGRIQPDDVLFMKPRAAQYNVNT